MLVGRSFIYTKNKRGPRTEPCGTPDLTRDDDEFLLLTVTNCDLLVRKHSNQDKIYGSILSRLSLYSSSLCVTLSKAFAKSRKMQSV